MTQEADIYAALRRDLAHVGVHPSTNEPFVRFHGFGASIATQVCRYGPPRPPSSGVYSDDDEPVYIRECTAEEMAAARAEFQLEMEQWVRTNGQFSVPGRTTITATFETAVGDTADGVWDGGKWVLISWYAQSWPI